LNLKFDILTDLHLKTAEQFRLVFVLPDYLRDLYKSFGSALDRFNDEPESCMVKKLVRTAGMPNRPSWF
jgi:hypothetical protein